MGQIFTFVLSVCGGGEKYAKNRWKIFLQGSAWIDGVPKPPNINLNKSFGHFLSLEVIRSHKRLLEVTRGHPFVILPVVFRIFRINVWAKKFIEVWYLSVFDIEPVNQWMSVKPMSDSFYMSRFIFNVPLSSTISHYRTVQPFWYWSSYLGCYRFF